MLRPVNSRLPSLVPATLAYLALPLLLFLLGWLKPLYALPAAGLLLLLLIHAGGALRTAARPGLKSLIVCGIVALLWTANSGAGGFGFQNWNFHKHNALLKALLVEDWPVLLGPDTSLVYAIAYYLPAAALGKAFGATTLGWQAVNLALFAWTAAGVWLTLLWFVHHARGRPEILAPLFVLLSGMDYLAALFVPRAPYELELFPEGIGFLQFSGMATGLSWAAQHSLPAWLGAALFLQLKDEPGFYRHALLFGACLCLWSSFAALGVALLMAAWLMMRPQHVRSALLPLASLWQGLGGALLCSVVLLYIGSNRFAFMHGFFASTITEHGLWPRYAFFLLVEFGMVALATFLLAAKGSWQRQLLVALAIILAAVPLYRVGWAHDMASRASLPALFALWCLVFSCFQQSQFGALRTRALQGVIVAAVAIGAVSALHQLEHSSGGLFAPPPLEAVPDIAKPNRFVVVQQYQGHRQSFFFRALAPNEEAP